MEVRTFLQKCFCRQGSFHSLIFLDFLYKNNKLVRWNWKQPDDVVSTCIGFNGSARRGKEMKKTVDSQDLKMKAMLPSSPPSD